MSPSMVSLRAITLNFSPLAIRVSAPKYEFKEFLRSFRNLPGVLPGSCGGCSSLETAAALGRIGSGGTGVLLLPPPSIISPDADEALEEVAPEDTPEELGEVSTEGVLAPTTTLFVEAVENGPILRVSKGLLTRSEHSPYLTYGLLEPLKLAW